MSRYLLNLPRGFRWGYLLLVVLLGLCVGGFAEINEETALRHLVINEIEINPSGFDTGNEWVELYRRLADLLHISWSGNASDRHGIDPNQAW
jgi:hypothetical protein